MKMEGLVRGAGVAFVCAGLLLAATGQLGAQSTSDTKGTVVEEIVARVNNEIITLTDYQKAMEETPKEVQQDCNCSGDQLQAAIADSQKNVLRGLIDQQLLIQRAKDMNIDVTSDVVNRLNDIRKQSNLATLDDLQKAVEADGQSWDDFKQNISNNAYTQEVIRQEVAGRVDIGQNEVKAYYDSHKADFNRPEEVVLSEIVLDTGDKTGPDLDAVKKRLEDIRARIVAGEDFASLAKRYSEDTSTSADGGDLGTYTHGQLAKPIEDAVFKLNKGDMTDVIQTKTGFMLLKVDQHYDAGEQPLEAVQDEIQNKIYQTKMDPQMRKYLAELREESYVWVRPGYVDSAALPNATVIQEVAPTPDAPDKKAKKKMPLPKVSG
jgi:peptidyl-prolyl cis-trans isomerase SurA